MPHLVVGLDLAPSGLKVCVIDVSIRGLIVRHTRTLPWLAATVPATPEPPVPDSGDKDVPVVSAPLGESGQRLTLKQMFQESPGDEVYVSMNGIKSSLRTLSFPVADMKKIEAMVGFELEDQLPRDIDEVMYSYIPIVQSRDRTELLLASIAKSEVATMLQDAEAANFNPRAIYCEPLCLLAFAPMMATDTVNQNGVIVDLGEKKTQICVIRQGKPIFARTLRSSNAIKPLVVGIRQTIHPYAKDVGDSPIYVTGENATTPDLITQLGQELEAQVTLLPLPPGLANEAEGHRYALAYAIAATGASSSRHPKIDFRKGEFSFRGDLSQLRSEAPRLGYAALALLFLAALSGIVRYSTLRSDEKKLDQTLKEVTHAIMGREIGDFKQALAAMNQSITPEKSPIPKSSAIDLFARLSKRIPADMTVHIDDIDIRDDHISLRGDTTTFETVDQVEGVLKSDDCFHNVTLGKPHKSTDGLKVEFSVTADVVCS